jgi:hypothetical protein
MRADLRVDTRQICGRMSLIPREISRHAGAGRHAYDLRVRHADLRTAARVVGGRRKRRRRPTPHAKPRCRLTETATRGRPTAAAMLQRLRIDGDFVLDLNPSTH